MLFECFFNVLEDGIGRLGSVDFPDQAQCIVVIDDWHGIAQIGLETLLQALFIIVRPPTSCCSSLKAAIHAGLRTDGKNLLYKITF